MNNNCYFFTIKGMVSLKTNQTIFLGDYIDMNLIDLDKSIFSSVSNLHPKNDQNVNELF